MIRVVNRPSETTTHYLEWPFHWCKNIQEIKNLTEGVDVKDITCVMRAVNPQSFQPTGYFIVNKRDKSFHDTLKFGATAEMMIDAGLGEAFGPGFGTAQQK